MLKGVSYIQSMLDILQDFDSESLTEAKVKLHIEKERFIKKAHESSLRRK